MDLTRVVSVFMLGMLVICVRGQNPEITLPGTSTVVRGTYIPYQESEYIGVDTQFEAFLGLPFAEPPVGEMRYEKPVKKEDLGPLYMADEHRALCYQAASLQEMSEDCLYLGVYTSSPRPTNAPVLVWIHGGGYTSGAGQWPVYEPVVMLAVSPEIVVVTINYRLGVLGFLTTGDSVLPGNLGLFDQVMALEWVRDNIAAFGGDPNQVTIMGESAGAGSVGLQLLTPYSDGLFSQAIMESGNALCPWALDSNMDRQTGFTEELATMVNCTTSSSEALVSCLKNVDPQVLIDAQGEMIRKYLVNELLFTPVIDHDFILDDPVNLMKRNEFKSVPTLMGTNEDEGTLLAIRVYPNYVIRKEAPIMTLEDFRQVLPLFLYYNTPAMVAAAEQWYIDWTQADNATADQLRAFIDLNTDQFFACGTEATSRYLEARGVPVYRYEMTHDPNWSIWLGIPGWLGAGHAEEIPFVFGFDLNPKLSDIVDHTDEEKEMSVQFIRYWTNFVRTGNPNTPLSTGEYPEWPRYALPDQDYKILAPAMENGRAMRIDSCAFWLDYLPKVYSSEPDQLYQDWQKEYEEWRDVSMAEWNQVFEDYKSDPGCTNP